MCGLGGYATEKYHKQLRDAGIVLALLNENRGDDSWGVSDGTEIIKDTGPIGMHIQKIPFERNIVAMHTRAATKGSISKDNAHPWKIGDIIGMHNGIISNHDELNKEHKKEYSVDSMQIFHSINEGDMTLSRLRGYGAVVFFDKHKKLRLAKFNGGSLAIAEIKDFKGIMWSSDEKHLERALDVADLDYILYKVKEHEVYMYEDGKLFKTKTRIRMGSSYAGGSHNTPVGPYNQHRQWRGSDDVREWEGWGSYRYYNGEFVWATCCHSFNCGCYLERQFREDSKVSDKAIKKISEPFGQFTGTGPQKAWMHCTHTYALVDKEDVEDIKKLSKEDLSTLKCTCLPRSAALNKMIRNEADEKQSCSPC